jgi:hypothetical protein
MRHRGAGDHRPDAAKKGAAAIVAVTPARERSKMAMPITRSSFRMFRLNVDCSMSKARAARQKAAVVRGCDGVAKLTDVKGHAQSSPSGRKRSFLSTITSPIGFRDPKAIRQQCLTALAGRTALQPYRGDG